MIEEPFSWLPAARGLQTMLPPYDRPSGDVDDSCPGCYCAWSVYLPCSHCSDHVGDPCMSAPGSTLT